MEDDPAKMLKTIKCLPADITSDQCRSEDAALERCQNMHFDLAIIDLHFNGRFNGINIAREIWEKFQIPIVFLSDQHYRDLELECDVNFPHTVVSSCNFEPELQNVVEAARKRQQENQSSFLKGRVLGKEFIFLNRIRLFRSLPEPTLLSLSRQARMISYKAGHAFSLEQEGPIPSLIPATGRVAFTRTSVEGKPYTSDIVGPGDCYAVILALETKTSPYSVIAQTAGSALLLPTRAVDNAVKSSPDVYRECACYLCNRLLQSHTTARQLAHEHIEVRIAVALDSLISKYAQYEPGEKEYVIEITRAQLAALVGTTPETAIRITKRFEKEGILDLSHPGIIRVMSAQPFQQKFPTYQ